MNQPPLNFGFPPSGELQGIEADFQKDFAELSARLEKAESQLKKLKNDGEFPSQATIQQANDEYVTCLVRELELRRLLTSYYQKAEQHRQKSVVPNAEKALEKARAEIRARLLKIGYCEAPEGERNLMPGMITAHPLVMHCQADVDAYTVNRVASDFAQRNFEEIKKLNERSQSRVSTSLAAVG